MVSNNVVAYALRAWRADLPAAAPAKAPATRSRLSKEQANLDCLRSFAVMAVLINHLDIMLASVHGRAASELGIELGGLGVLAFFVHTSLVLMLSLERQQSEIGGRLALRFYIRRIFRIYPLAICCVLCVLLLKIPAFPILGQAFTPPSAAVVIGNLLLIQNLIGRTSVSSPLWSLPFEIEMYAFLPALFAVAIRRKALLYLVGMMAAACVIGWAVFTTTGHASLLAFVPCFLSGIIAYTLRSKIRPFLPAAAWPWFVFFWLGLSAWSREHYSAAELPISWLACLILGLSIYCFLDSTNAIWNRLTHTVAKYSFGIYLSHVPVMKLAFRMPFIRNDVAVTLLWLALTAIVSVTSFHLIEQPMINVGRRLSLSRFFSHSQP